MGVLLGIANADIPHHPGQFTEAMMLRWRRWGVRCISVGFSQPYDWEPAAARELRTKLADHGIAVVQMAGINANFVHLDESVRAEGRRRVEVAIDRAVAVGTAMILSGCGSNALEAGFYAPHRDNFGPAAREVLVAELSALVPRLTDVGLQYAIECHQLSTMCTPEVIREVLDAVDSPAVVANFDPVNLLNTAAAVYDNAARMQDMIDVVGPRYASTGHVKDVQVGVDLACHISEAAPGEGLLDFGGLFAAVARLGQPTSLLVEHLGADQAAIAFQYVRKQAEAHGVELL